MGSELTTMASFTLNPPLGAQDPKYEGREPPKASIFEVLGSWGSAFFWWIGKGPTKLAFNAPGN